YPRQQAASPFGDAGAAFPRRSTRITCEQFLAGILQHAARLRAGMWRRLRRVTLAIPVLAASGCALLGTASLRIGRTAYNDTILTTDSQQLLATIVRMRYGEPSSLLAVSS